MFEAPLPGEHHGHARLIAGLDALAIACRAAGLDDGGDPFADPYVHAIPKREEGVGYHGAPDQPALPSGDLRVNRGPGLRVLQAVVRALVLLPSKPSNTP